jgi:hypothetical protein
MCSGDPKSDGHAAFVSLKVKFDSYVFFLHAKRQSCVVMAHQIKKLNPERNCSYSLANYLRHHMKVERLTELYGSSGHSS